MASQQCNVASKKATSPTREDNLVVESLLTRGMRDSPVGRGSPVDSPLVRRAAMSLLLGVPSSDVSLSESVMSWSMDEDDSSRDSPRQMGGASPEPVDGHKRHTLKQYKNELWAAIRPDFMYLMDEEIIDACKSTESEISSDDMCVETKVSYNEFLQQYKELTDWLGYLQLAVSRQTASRSESYLNQMYHEEMLTQSPRQQLFKDYAKELLRRYPQLKQEIMLRLTHVSELWYEVMDKLVLPSGGGRPDLAIILKDIEEDVTSLRLWVNTAEKAMACLSISPEWSLCTIQAKLVEHQTVQKDIESRSRVVSAVMKLCEWMDKIDNIDEKLEAECRVLHSNAANLEQRWHGIWIQSVEWQVRLEDALSGKNTRRQFFLDNGKAYMYNERVNSVDSLKRHTGHDSVSELTDEGNSDVIPFRESDYEEIMGSDQDDFDEKQNADIELCRSDYSEDRDRMMLDEWMDGELDSELKHELSDHCVDSKEYDETKSASESINVNSSGILSNVGEIFDIGYSSESHSYDDRETMDSMTRIKERAIKNDVHLVDDVSETAEVLPIGRQSATSAYNSLSDLSDNHRSSVACELPKRVPNNNYYCTAAIDLNDSSAASSADHHCLQIPHIVSNGIADDCCTDDDFSKLKELSFDDIPMMFMNECSEVPESQKLSRRQGRSLDSLVPYDSEKMFKFEKRVSSVEVIIDSLSVCKDTSANVCAEIMLHNSLLTSKTERATSGPSSCDASSEGTVSDSEGSESVVSEDDSSPRKYKSPGRGRRDKVRLETPIKHVSNVQVKSPLKRRGDSLTDISDIGELDRCLRSSSDGAINDLTSGHSTSKRSKVCRTQSDILFEKSVIVSSTPRIGMQSDCRSNVKVSSRKSRSHAVTQLKFDKGCQDDTDVSILSNVSNDAVVPDMNKDELNGFTKSQDISMYSDMHCQHWDTDEDSEYVKYPYKSGRSKCGRSSLIVSNRNGSKQSWEDSDSDTEDFLNIVAESRKAFSFTESTLQMFLKDHIDGVIRDPIEFNGPLATCQTNVKCMLELVDALESGIKMRDADNKIQQINSIVSRWQQLEAQTVSQQQQCRLLYILYTERIRCEKQLSAMLQEISVDRFLDLPGLEAMCRTVQVVRSELQTKVDHQLKLLGHKINQFQNTHSTVDTSRFDASIEKLQQTASTLLNLCNRKESYLKKLLMAWYQLTELQCHLEYVITHEEHQIDCLDIATDIVHLSQADFNDTVNDLQVMCESWSVHNDKLQLMESLRDELIDVCSADGQVALDSVISSFTNRLTSLRLKCDKMIERMTSSSMMSTDNELEDHMNTEDIQTMDSLYLSPETIQNEGIFEHQMIIEALKSEVEDITTEKQEEPASISEEQVSIIKNRVVHNTVSSNAIRRFLKYALPLPMLLMLIFGGLYLLYDDWFDQLDGYGLCFAPQLHHVRGAPPI